MPATAGRLAVLLSLLVLLPGCTSPKYKRAAKATPPAVLLNLPSTEPPIEALLHTVIIYGGAGSWKREAYWDEYVVTVANRGDTVVTVDAAELTEFQDQTVTPGTDPWALQLTSLTLAKQGFGFARDTAVQIGGGVGVLAIGGGVGAVVFSGGMVSAGAGAAVGGLLLLPAVIGGTIYSNVSNRHAIEREFARRRLVLPATLLPGQFAQGSFFFRIAPGPKKLTLRCSVDRAPHVVVIDLAPLAGLHLKAAPTKPATETPPK